MMWGSLLLFGGILLLLYRRSLAVDKARYFGFSYKNGVSHETKQQALAIERLSYSAVQRWFNQRYELLRLSMGPRFALHCSVIVVLSCVLARWLSVRWLAGNYLLLTAFFCGVAGLVAWVMYMTQQRRKQFEERFPDALNMMMSAVTAGESLIFSMDYVGGVMDNAIGREFRYVAERLKLGEAYEDVFARSLQRFPYPAYLFFIISLKSNLARGGELKPLLQRLIRVLVNSRAMEKRKYALTSEARLSAKIVASFPVIFLVLMQFISPGNMEFVLHDPEGQKILWYVMGSELLGLSTIWLLVRRVKV